jgi:hypothetical protein
MWHKKHNKNGFTITEIVVVAPIFILAIGAFVGVIISITGEVLASRASTVLSYNVHDALNRIEQDIKLSSGFLATNNIVLTSPQGYDDNTANFQNTGANGTMLILNMPTTTGNPLNSQDYVYANAQPNSCLSGLSSRNIKLMYNVVYFVKNNVLWRRVIAPSNYTYGGCATPWQEPSCSPGTSGAICLAQDIQLVDGISSTGFNIDYYTNISSTTTNNSADPVDANRQIILRTTNTAVVTITSAKSAAGRNIAYSGSIRASSKSDNFLSAAIINVPGNPTSLTATPGVGQITLNWTAPASNGGTAITNYKIFRGTASGNETLYTTVNNVLTYTNTGTGTTRYYYYVKAVNPIGDSAQSNEANAQGT